MPTDPDPTAQPHQVEGPASAAGRPRLAPDVGNEARRVIGVVLVLVGAVVAGERRRRFRLVQSAMRRGGPLPGTGLIQILAWVLIAISLAAAALVLFI